MAYTVKKVAAMSGVSVRTLHFYDQNGLLKPAHVGANGYRFYEQPQLLKLQQVLFYRELGFELKEIKRILGRPGFKKSAALRSHRKTLKQNLERTCHLIATIDNTLAHLKGRKKMTGEEIFAGFTVAAGSDRFGQRTLLGGPRGDLVDCKISAGDTGGSLCVLELTAKGGGPKHAHCDQDEWIYVIAGEFEVHVGKKQLHLRPGESIFIPRKSPHVWTCLGESPGRILNAYQPAGTIEAFFHEVGKYDGNPPIHEALGIARLRKMFAEHGMDLLGPPLGWDESKCPC